MVHLTHLQLEVLGDKLNGEPSKFYYYVLITADDNDLPKEESGALSVEGVNLLNLMNNGCDSISNKHSDNKEEMETFSSKIQHVLSSNSIHFKVYDRSIRDA